MESLHIRAGKEEQDICGTTDIEIGRVSAIDLVEVADGKRGPGGLALVNNPLNPQGDASGFVGPPIFYVGMDSTRYLTPKY